MCHTVTPEEMPLNVPDSSMPDDTLGHTLAAAGMPRTVTVNKPTTLGRVAEVASGGLYDPTGGMDTTAPPTGKPTKFGALMKVLQPALEGGLIGWAGGKGHPGGGFGAANDYYMRQRQMQMQYQMLARQFYNDRFRNELEQARTLHEVSLPPITRVPNTIKGKDANGNEIFMSLNPRSMQWEPVEGIQPDRTNTNKTVMTDRGLMSVDASTGRAVPVTADADAQPGPDGNAPTATGSVAPSKFDSGSPRLPGTASQSPSGVAAVASRIPLHAPNFGTPRATIRASRNSAGVEQDAMFDTNPNSPTFGQRLGSLGNTRQPLPDRSENRQAQKTSLDASIENYAAEALKQNGNDPNRAIQYLNGLKNSDPDIQKSFSAILPKIRQRVRDRVRLGKNRFNLPAGVKPSDLDLSPTNQGVVDEDDSDNPQL